MTREAKSMASRAMPTARRAKRPCSLMHGCVKATMAIACDRRGIVPTSLARSLGGIGLAAHRGDPHSAKKPHSGAFLTFAQ